jgi:xanthine dehydrogenase accessory factor
VNGWKQSEREATALVLGSDVVGSAIAHALHRLRWDVVLIDEIDPPGPWRGMSFVNAWYLGTAELEGLAACFCSSVKSIPAVLHRQNLIAATSWSWLGVAAALFPDVVIDARSADGGEPEALRLRAPRGLLTLGCGPGTRCGDHVDIAIDTAFGPDAGTVVHAGTTAALGERGDLAGASVERLLRAPRSGRMRTQLRIGDCVRARDPVGDVNGEPVIAVFDGVMRGLSARGARVASGQVVAEIDPRGQPALCHGIDPRGAAVAAGVIEALRTEGLARNAEGAYRNERHDALARQ